MFQIGEPDDFTLLQSVADSVELTDSNLAPFETAADCCFVVSF